MDKKEISPFEKDIIEWYEKDIILPPGLVCPKWSEYVNIIGGAKQLFELQRLIGSFRHNCRTPLQNVLKTSAFKLFMDGSDPLAVWALLDIPKRTARDYFKLIEPYL